jgi:hypothetical protein
MATLNLHSSEGGLSHTSAPIRSYALCNEDDVACLFSRLSSIFVWAENVHLPFIIALLDSLDAVVQLQSGTEHVTDAFPSAELDGMTSHDTNASPIRTKLKAVKGVLTQISPHWIRVS